MLVVWEQTNAFLLARVMELVDVPDSKSGGVTRAGSSPALGTILARKLFAIIVNKW